MFKETNVMIIEKRFPCFSLGSWAGKSRRTLNLLTKNIVVGLHPKLDALLVHFLLKYIDEFRIPCRTMLLSNCNEFYIWLKSSI